MSLINQFSYILFVVVLGVILVAVMWRWKKPRLTWQRGVVIGSYTLMVILLNAALPFPTNNIDIVDYAEIEQLIENDQPTFIMLYSHFCIGCIASLPSVRALEDDIEAKGIEIDMLFLDIHTEIGQQARENLPFEITPTYILFDAAGEQVLVTNSTPDAQTLVSLLAG